VESNVQTDTSAVAQSQKDEGVRGSAPAYYVPETLRGSDTRYVLISAAHNEEATIERTIESVLSQTKPPERWAIVSDSSDDRTDQIIQAYETDYPCIKYGRVTRAPGRSFASKIIALRIACRLLENMSFDLIGNIDADVTLQNTYFATLVERFDSDPTLGIAGGWIYEQYKGRYISRRFNSTESVPHAAQLVRRTCYEAIGGYALLRYGGEDWHALVSAQMNGWRAEAFQELIIYHHRPNRTLFRSGFQAGRMDYSFGSYPAFEIVKCLRRSSGPLLAEGLIRMCGFLLGYLVGEERQVTGEFIEFLRRDQKQRLMASLKGLIY